MDLESVIQSGVSQKEKNRYHILMHVSGIWKNGIDVPICKGETDRRIEDKRKVTKLQWGGGGMDWKTGIDTYIHTIDFMYKIDN